MTRKKKEEEEIVVDPNEPLRKCYDCLHWHSMSETLNVDYDDYSSGSCDHNGYSKCPPLFSCKGWKHVGNRKSDRHHMEAL